MNTVINIKTKKDLKHKAQKTAGDLNCFGSALTMTPKLENLLGKIEYDVQKGKNLSQVIASKKELKNYPVFV